MTYIRTKVHCSVLDCDHNNEGKCSVEDVFIGMGEGDPSPTCQTETYSINQIKEIQSKEFACILERAKRRDEKRLDEKEPLKIVDKNGVWIQR